MRAEEKLGLERKAPFDKMLVSATIAQLPEELITQLNVGGTLVIPIREAIWQVHKTSATQCNIHKYPGFVFVPLQS